MIELMEMYWAFVSLPMKGMGIIEQLDPPSFSNYIKKYRNTICGRHPIGVLLNVSTIEELQWVVTVKHGSGTKFLILGN